MTCREVERSVDLFLDGELDGRVMRAIALHVTRCAACEKLVHGLERLQDLVADAIEDAVGDVDFSRFWSDVTHRAAAVGVVTPYGAAADERRRRSYPRGVVAGAALAAMLALAFAFWPSSPGLPPPRVDNQAHIASLVSDADSITLLSEPVTRTTVIWVTNEARR
jgi:hypothetical protein